MPLRIPRRHVLAAPVLVAAHGLAARQAWAQPGGTPFTLGVASGEPAPDGFVIWTRLAPDPLNGGGMPAAPVAADWEVATDPGFVQVVRRGQEQAQPADAHSLHVVVSGLQPDRPYWYRFRAGGQISPVGRARTAPAATAAVARLRLVLASCQNWEHGYFTAWRGAAAEGAELVCFVGDYIYEYRANPRRPLRARAHQDWAAVSLAQYRDRYALYKTDPDLQRAHAAAPWIVTWDDHEVVNDYAADRPEVLAQKPDFLARRAAAYQAFWEHMPLSPALRPRGADAHVYRRLDWGRLARLHVLDNRQYRDYQACPRPELGGGSATVGAECAERLRAERTMLGMAQEAWLAEGLTTSPARWNAILQQTIFAPFQQGSADSPKWWTDAWEGYPAARDRLLAVLASGRVRNPLILGGDVHCFYANDIPAGGRVVATEFIGSSISSRGWRREQLAPFLPLNPHIRFAEPERRGYALVDLMPGGTEVTFRAVLEPLLPESTVETLARFRVRDGAPGVIHAG